MVAPLARPDRLQAWTSDAACNLEDNGICSGRRSLAGRLKLIIFLFTGVSCWSTDEKTPSQLWPNRNSQRDCCSKMPRLLEREGLGMKKILLLSCASLAVHIAGPTMAADWPVLAPTYEAAPLLVYSWWTGCYLGGNLGGAWSRAEYVLDNTVAVERFTFKPLGVVGGGQFGCQYQWNSLVFGLEGTYSWANLRHDQESVLLPDRQRSIGIDQIGTTTAKLGYAWDRTMLYAKGGWAGARLSAGR